MIFRSAAREHSRRAAIVAEVNEVWERLTGPDGRDLTDSTSSWIVVGIAPAAACYVMPTWARGCGSTGVPLWWTWPESTWASGGRRQEFLLAAALSLAALDHCIPERRTPALSVVRDVPDTSSTGQAGLRRIAGRREEILAQVELARTDLIDHEGLDPAHSLRPSAIESLLLATACYLLPPEMREVRAGVPLMWAWPTTSWIEHPDRESELTTATAMALAAIELHDREEHQSRTSALAVIDGGAAAR